ncbi:hypothetical protein ACICHK_40295 [Streptomyces sp. AHU1]|uniref:hypothetical protein n=1 Tax=Streptomyces sp. AHU1 TaxID=3377215 RepID=UPI00387839C9
MGIAAPQIGIAQAAAAVQPAEEGAGTIVLLNPRITANSSNGPLPAPVHEPALTRHVRQLRSVRSHSNSSSYRDPSSTAVELIEAGLARTAGDLIVHIPDTNVVWAGDVLFIGDIPVR